MTAAPECGSCQGLKCYRSSSSEPSFSGEWTLWKRWILEVLKWLPVIIFFLLVFGGCPRVIFSGVAGMRAAFGGRCRSTFAIFAKFFYGVRLMSVNRREKRGKWGFARASTDAGTAGERWSERLAGWGNSEKRGGLLTMPVSQGILAHRSPMPEFPARCRFCGDDLE